MTRMVGTIQRTVWRRLLRDKFVGERLEKNDFFKMRPELKNSLSMQKEKEISAPGRKNSMFKSPEVGHSFIYFKKKISVA